MFDFAISRNQRQRPTRRFFAAWVASCIVHLLLLILLVQFPQLLRGGMYHRFRPLAAIANVFGSETENDEKDWRTVTVLRTPMMEPSAATLKKYMKDWSQKPANLPPIELRWGNEQKKALEDSPPMPRVQNQPKAPVVLPPPNPSPVPGSQDGSSMEASPGSSSIVQADPNAGRKGAVNLTPPAPAPKPEVAAGNPPASIPDGVKPPPATQPSKDSVKLFENEQQAIRSSESGFFDAPKGFPLGEYADLIKERIKEKWYIPSNLRNSQGHTTIIFYISKDGRYNDARIEPSASSGNRSLDIAALKAIIDSSPFPPLPKGFPRDRLGAKFVLSYNEPSQTN